MIGRVVTQCLTDTWRRWVRVFIGIELYKLLAWLLAGHVRRKFANGRTPVLAHVGNLIILARYTMVA
ncbi:hypothetical protein GCM10009022_48710 [Vreelandella titanicae]